MPAGTIAGRSLTIVVAIMSFLACLTLGAVTLVRDASLDWQSDIVREITIQVRPVDGVDYRCRGAAKAVADRRILARRRRAPGSFRPGRIRDCWSPGSAAAST